MTESVAADRRTPFWRDTYILLLVAAGVIAAALYPLRISEAFGLPAHPLLLHAPVVMVPELVLAVIALALRPAWRIRFGLAAGLGALVAMAATLLAAGSGKALKKDMGGGPPDLARHEDLGDTLQLLMIGLTVVFLILLLLDGRSAPHVPRLVLSAVVIVLAVVSLVWLIRTGDVGARMVWEDTGGS